MIVELTNRNITVDTKLKLREVNPIRRGNVLMHMLNVIYLHSIMECREQYDWVRDPMFNNSNYALHDHIVK